MGKRKSMCDYRPFAAFRNRWWKEGQVSVDTELSAFAVHSSAGAFWMKLFQSTPELLPTSAKNVIFSGTKTRSFRRVSWKSLPSIPVCTSDACLHCLHVGQDIISTERMCWHKPACKMVILLTISWCLTTPCTKDDEKTNHLPLVVRITLI